MTPTVVYTDGACLGNPGPGGWAWAVPDGPFASGADERTTNQRMEICAALEAARALPRPLRIVSDSTYVVNCFRDGWWVGWEKRGWLNKAKKPVANRDLWEPLIELYKVARGELTFDWVKGHSGDPMNDLVDRLAVEAATTQQGRSGEGRPTDLGPADAPAAKAPSTGGPALPDGHRLLVAGLRPPELGGYDPNPVADEVRRRLVDILQAKAKLHPDLLVVTGLGLGAEQLGAEAAAEAGVPYVAALPYPDPDEVWPAASRARYRELRDGATAVVTLQSKRPTSRQQAGGAIARRDAWLARSVAEAVVVWDGEEDRAGKLVRSLVVQLGEEEVWVVEPA
jgi:ribonuclease HI